MPKQIPLTRGLYAIVDDCDFEHLSSFKWHAHYEKSTDSFRAYRHVSGTRNKTKSMTEQIMGVREGFVVDHKNRSTLDNTRENLRWATLQQNCQNRIRAKKSTLPNGVFMNNGGKFTARIKLPSGKRISVGTFASEFDAGAAYSEATQKYFGEFSPN